MQDLRLKHMFACGLHPARQTHHKAQEPTGNFSEILYRFEMVTSSDSLGVLSETTCLAQRACHN